MSSIIQQIQQDALNEAVAISSLLRKAFLVASKLGLNEERDWIGNELSGWRESSGEPPDCRRFLVRQSLSLLLLRVRWGEYPFGLTATLDLEQSPASRSTGTPIGC